MLNKFVFMGRLTRDPETRTTAAGKTVTQLSVACERDAKNPDGSRSTDFIDCVAWNQTGEFVQRYFRKGQMIVIESRLGSRSWTDKDGKKRVSWEASVNNVWFAGSKDAAQTTQSTGAPQMAADFSMLDGEDEDMPF